MSKPRLTSRLVIPAMLMALLWTGWSQSVSAGILSNQLVAKAPPDECFVGIGSSSNNYSYYPPAPACTMGMPKVNQAYVWGLTEYGSQLWFGTIANTQCLVVEGYLGILQPFQTESYVCESSENHQFGSDWRPPKIYSYDLNTGVLTDETTLPTYATVASELYKTAGIRSAGSLPNSNVIFLGGPLLPLRSPSGIVLFAFKPDGTFLGDQEFNGSGGFPKYTDIRIWLVFNNNLYVGVEAADGTGRILHWRDNSSDPTYPFDFEEVGKTNAEVAYLTSQGNRLYVTTWGGANVPSRAPSGLWVSPPTTGGSCPAGVICPADLGNWTEIWNVNNYEVDPATATTLVGGATASYKGMIYFGLMQVPFTGALAHYTAYPNAPSGSLDKLESIVNTTRPIPIFRTNGDPANTQTELLYGSALLPKYDGTTQSWNLVPNASGSTPLYGPAGFGNPFNTYTWAANVYAGHLFVGTFNWTYLLVDGLPLLAQELGLTSLNAEELDALGPLASPFADFSDVLLSGETLTSISKFLENNQLLQDTVYGANLWRFDNGFSPAQPENVTGVGNYLNYGVRSMISDSQHLYVGTANPMNLKTGPGEKGGWELRILTAHGWLPGFP